MFQDKDRETPLLNDEKLQQQHQGDSDDDFGDDVNYVESDDDLKKEND